MYIMHPVSCNKFIDEVRDFGSENNLHREETIIFNKFSHM